MPIQAKATFGQTTDSYTEMTIHYQLDNFIFAFLKIVPIICAVLLIISILTLLVQMIITAVIGMIFSAIGLFIQKQRANHQAYLLHCDIKDMLNATSLS